MLEYGIKIPRDIAFHLLFESGLDDEDQVNYVLDWLPELEDGFVYFQHIEVLLISKEDMIAYDEVLNGHRFNVKDVFRVLDGVQKSDYELEPEVCIPNKGPIKKRGKGKVDKYGGSHGR